MGEGERRGGMRCRCRLWGGKRTLLGRMWAIGRPELNSVGTEEDYRRLREDWLAGDRDREHSLHLLFLAWMHWADPPFVTGMSDDPDADKLWQEVFAHFGGEGSSDAEFLHVAGLMAHLFPWALGDESLWKAAAERLKARSLQLRPEGFTPELFEGRGDFGEYFAHQARVAPTPH